MFARGLVLAGLLLGTLAAPALADNSLALSSGSTAVAVQGPSTNGTISAVVCSPVNTNWAGAISSTSWISANANCTADMPAGDYTYTVSFNMPSGATGQQLSGSVMADDNVTVQLNGNTLLNGGGSSGSTPFSTTNTGLFTTGTNTLTFVVHNSTAAAPNTTGLDFQATVSASNVTPTASNPVANGNGEGEGRGRGACVSALAHEFHGLGHHRDNGSPVAAALAACRSGGPGAAAVQSDNDDNDSD